MSQSNVEVPPAAPAAATPPAVVTPPAPAAVSPPAMIPAAAPVAVPAAPPLASSDAAVDPNWFKPRLERERKATLKAAGFDSEEDAKAAAKALKDQREAEKALATKLAERDVELTKTKTRAEQLEAATKEYAGRMLIGLTEAQKKAVSDIAGDDPAAQIKAITALTPTWAKEEAAAVAAVAAAAPPAVATAPVAAAPAAAAPPANTAPGRVAPVGGDGSPPNHRAVYEKLKETNPFAAADYAMRHAADVYAAKS